MSDEMILECTERDGIMIDEYKGMWGLIAMEKGHNDVWYKRWVFLSTWKNKVCVPDDKKRPMAVRLGDKETALKVLKKAIQKIESIKE